MAEAFDEVDAALARHGVVFTDRVVDLNVLRMRLRSNAPDFPGYAYFTRFADPTGPGAHTADYRVDCVDLDRAAEAGALLDDTLLAGAVDDTFRAKHMRAGFYLTTHFGDPAWLRIRGRHLRLCGRRLERAVWPYVVKHLLTVHAADTGTLHLKAAGFVDPHGGATLLFGRGGAGKTVFLAGACEGGMAFLTNTHVLLDGDVAYGVPSAMRIRDDACFGPLIRRGGLSAHLERGQYTVDPARLFAASRDTAVVRNLCIVDWRPDRPTGLRELPVDTCYEFLEQFAFPVSAYGLKDDLLAHVDGDLDRYTTVYAAMKQQLRRLVSNCRLWLANVDMLDPVRRRDVLATLSTPARADATR